MDSGPQGTRAQQISQNLGGRQHPPPNDKGSKKPKDPKKPKKPNDKGTKPQDSRDYLAPDGQTRNGNN